MKKSEDVSGCLAVTLFFLCAGFSALLAALGDGNPIGVLLMVLSGLAAISLPLNYLVNKIYLTAKYFGSGQSQKLEEK